MKNKYPIFIPTKNRSDSRLTIKLFEQLGVSYTAVIEEQEIDKYAQVINKKNLLILPHRDKGLTVTRNWIWDYAQSQGYEKFWTFDDNIECIYRLYKNKKLKVADGTCLKVIEDFADRYDNLYITGMNYQFFCKEKQKLPPFYLNTRVYSNMLIKTNIPYRNELFFNDDTDLCLRIMKDGFCTCQINAFLINKMTTMAIKGGMTDYYEKTDKRLQFAQELVNKHPDVARVTWKFNRWHHEVDYTPFEKNKLIRKQGIEIPKGINNYGMVLKEIDK